MVDSVTSQNIVPETLISDADTTYGAPRVFLLGNYFVILYTKNTAGVYSIKRIAISTQDPAQVAATTTVVNTYSPADRINFDGITVNDRLYLAYNVGSPQAIVMRYISANLSVSGPHSFVGSIATMLTLAADSASPSAPIIYVSFYDTVSQNGYVVAVDSNLNTVLAPTLFVAGIDLNNLASTADSGSMTIFYEVINAYSYDAAIRTDYIKINTVSQGGTVGTSSVLKRSLSLASKAFRVNGVSYFLAVYQSDYQPTYFLVGDNGDVISILAYSNANGSGAGVVYAGLPFVTVTDDIATTSYLFKESITAVNKEQGLANPAGVYAQLGIKLVSFDFSPPKVVTSEIGQNLNITGGFLTMYDGVKPVEQGFFVYPEYIETTPGNAGGSMSLQQYFYQVVYSWADNQGNLFRSSPSIPVSATVGAGQNRVTVHIPTLRLTYKLNSPVTIEVYRWSTAQQSYYQTTSIQTPLLNDPTVDSVDYVDVKSDAQILGNNLIYTTGGVLENIVPPATDVLTLFNNRLWLVDSEDRNLLWFSKPVFEATPVEMSDLLTLYVSPTTGSEGSTGPITALGPMDDKLIVFKENALGYISGQGPDITGANNQYSDFNLITSVVGCVNQSSIVFTPNGLMFQSKKGIWLLSRNLSTDFIGSPVQLYTDDNLVLSAENIPTSNQVRFTMDSGITLIYDYYNGQWGTFSGVPSLSSTIYQNLQTYIDKYQRVFQETPGLYLDGSKPVLMAFTTGWMNLAGLQGFERFYEFYLLGKYKSAFKLKVDLAYDYNPSPSQSIIVTPEQTPSTWGSNQLWGSGNSWGNGSQPFEARIFPAVQKCESFQITITEIFDSSLGTIAGEGLSLSGINIIAGLKKGSRTSPAKRSFG